jgi:chromosomal replication initiation ATPase DnaA
MSEPDDQLVLPFVHSPSYGPDFLEAASNSDALAWLRRTAEWPERRLALWGGRGCGKTHLLNLWAAGQGVPVIAGHALAHFAPPDGALAIDDADAAPPLALLHTLNSAAEAGYPVLIAAAAAPARWDTKLADLRSRLRAITAVEIAAPEESLLRALLARLLADRQLAIPEAVQDYVLLRMPRTAAAVRDTAARLDRLGQRPTKAVAKAILDELSGLDAPGVLHANETSAAEPLAVSQRGGSLL